MGGGGQRSAAKDTIKVSCIASAISLGLELNMNGLVSRQKGVWGGWVGGGCVPQHCHNTGSQTGGVHSAGNVGSDEGRGRQIKNCINKCVLSEQGA